MLSCLWTCSLRPGLLQKERLQALAAEQRLCCVELSLALSGAPDRKKESVLAHFSAGEAGRVARRRSLSSALSVLPGSLTALGPDVFPVNQAPLGGKSLASGFFSALSVSLFSF